MQKDSVVLFHILPILIFRFPHFTHLEAHNCPVYITQVQHFTAGSIGAFLQMLDKQSNGNLLSRNVAINRSQTSNSTVSHCLIHS